MEFVEARADCAVSNSLDSSLQFSLNMNKRRLRVLVIASHVVQYTASVFRRAAVHPGLEFHVAYCSLRGAEAGPDVEFGSIIQWDVPLLDGYDWIEVKNKGSGSDSFWGLFN